VVGAPSTPTPRGLFSIVGAWRGNPDEFLGAWTLGRGVPVLVAGLLLGAAIPFTLLVWGLLHSRLKLAARVGY